MSCKYCGIQVQSDAEYCPNCGKQQYADDVAGICATGECRISYSKIKEIALLPEANPLLNILGMNNHIIRISTTENNYAFPYISEANKVIFEIRSRMS